jgi:hypothetical protein
LKHLVYAALGAASLAALLPACYSAVPDPIYTPCPITGSSDWTARYDDAAGEKPSVLVTGKVTVPSGGYEVALEKGYVQRLDPPRQQVIVRLIRPEGMATQALETHDLSLSFRPDDKAVDGVTIRCGDKTLASISPLPRGN